VCVPLRVTILGTGFVIVARMDYARVAFGRPLRDVVLGLEHEHLELILAELPCHRAPDAAGPDDNHVILVRTKRREPALRAAGPGHLLDVVVPPLGALLVFSADRFDASSGKYRRFILKGVTPPAEHARARVYFC